MVGGCLAYQGTKTRSERVSWEVSLWAATLTMSSMSNEYNELRALFKLAPSLRRADGRVLSVYLPARAEGFDDRHYDIVFGDLRHRYRERLEERELAVLEAELPRVRTRLGIVRPAGVPAIAGFAQSEPDLLEVFGLPLPTDERLEVGDPLLAPALRQLEEVPPALVAVVDKERARVFGFILGHAFEVAEIEGVDVHHSRAGATSAPSNQRKADNRAHKNLEHVAQVVAREFGLGVYQHLLIAGPQEARADFERTLPPGLRARVAGHLGASLDSATLVADIRHKLLKIEVPVEL